MKTMCDKESKNLYALPRIAKYISANQKGMLFKSFIITQFNNCPVVWMFKQQN